MEEKIDSQTSIINLPYVRERCQVRKHKRNRDNDLQLLEIKGEFVVVPSDYHWPERPKFPVDPIGEQEDLFPMNFFGEVVYDENDEDVVIDWGQCEEDEEDIRWDD
jgi:hypothetical protein